MIPGICNVCGTTLYGSNVYDHIARCIEAPTASGRAGPLRKGDAGCCSEPCTSR